MNEQTKWNPWPNETEIFTKSGDKTFFRVWLRETTDMNERTNWNSWPNETGIYSPNPGIKLFLESDYVRLPIWMSGTNGILDRTKRYCCILSPADCAEEIFVRGKRESRNPSAEQHLDSNKHLELNWDFLRHKNRRCAPLHHTAWNLIFWPGRVCKEIWWEEQKSHQRC
jgi:hypothetical protein